MKKYTLQEKIRKTFILVFTVIILVANALVFTIIGKVYWDKTTLLCEQLVNLNLDLLNNQTSHIEGFLDIISSNPLVKDAVQYYQSSTVRDYGVELTYKRNMDEAFNLLSETREVSNAYIVDKRGHYIYFYGQSLIKDYNLLREDWYEKIIEEIRLNTCYVSGIHDRTYLVNNRDDTCISIVKPIQIYPSYVFKPDAYLVCDIDLDVLLRYVEQQGDVNFAFMDSNNIIYTQTPLPLSATDQQKIVLAAEQKDKHQQVVGRSLFSGSIAVFMKSELYGWKVLGVKELSEIRDINMTVMIVLAVVLLFAIYCIVIVSKRVAKSMLSPMNRLIASCNQVAEGDYSAVFEEAKSEEITILTETISTMVKNVVQLSEKVLEDEKRISEEKLRVLQHQINPHFINNILQTIKSFSISNETTKISRMSTLLGTILAYSVYQPHQNVSIETELNYLTSYIEMQNIRFEDRILVSLRCDPEVKPMLIPKLTLQPLVENAIEHGFVGDNKLVLDINAYREGDMAYIIINDNGRGIPAQTLEKIKSDILNHTVYAKANSIGIVNVSERLEKMYGEGYGVQIVSKVKNGTTVIIRIPFKDKEKA